MIYNRNEKTMSSKMDGKKTKRRKSVGGKRHGSMEEKPKSTEVMNEKEKQDRLDAASALSSLMFLPPLSADADDDESNTKTSQETPSNTNSHLRSLSSLPRIPNTLGITSQLPKRGRPPNSSTVEAISAARNKAILANLEKDLKLRMAASDNMKTSSTSRAGVISSRLSKSTQLLSNPLPLTLPHSKLISKHVPLTVIPQTHMVNQDVAKALRNAMSKNTVKTESVDRTIDVNMGRQLSPALSTSTQDVEKVEGTLSSVSVKKRDNINSDTNLPLKKRRLVGMMNSSSSNADSEPNVNSCVSLGTLATCRQIDDILQMETEQMNAQRFQTSSVVSADHISKPDEGYRPVHVDPRTSLLVLSDLKFALTPDEDGDLPLHIAVVHEDTELVKKYVDIMMMSGKTVDRFNKLQQTPLHLAILVNKPDIMKALLSAGANPNLLDRHGCTSVHSCVCKQFDKCMDTVLQDAKMEINLNCRDYEGYFPLHTCVELDNIKMLSELVKWGADVNSQDGKAGRSVLMYAVEYNRCEIVHHLLENGANAELQNYAGVTPLMIAQAGKMDNILNLLNVALDNVRVEEQQYIQAKKVPIARVPSRTDFSESKRRPSMNGIPLVYEEYERSRESPDSRQAYSRQSSTSSPIDLSMKGNNVPTPTSTAELTRGKPPRKKGKKESKNHKEKHSLKSNVIEKHASLVAALESKAVVEKSDDKLSDVKTSQSDELSERANAFKNLFLNLNPMYAQKLFEKMNQAYGLQLKSIPDVTQMPGVRNDHIEGDVSDKVQNNKTMQIGDKAGLSQNDSNVGTLCQTVENDKCKDLDSKQKTEHIEGVTSELTEKINDNEEDVESSVCVSNKCDSSGTLHDVTADDTNIETNTSEPMDEAESPDMPVLSRATSECFDTNENAVDDLVTSAAQSVSNSPVPVIYKVSTDHDSNNEQDDTQNTDHSMDTKPETEVTSSNEIISEELINSKDNNSKIKDDQSASFENPDVVNEDTDNVSLNERLIDSSVDSSNHSDTLRIQSLPEHSDQSELNRSTMNIDESTLSTSVLVDSSDIVDEDCEVYSDHSDDSMEVELSDVMKNKISGKTEVYNTSEIVKNKVLVVNESKLVVSTDNVRNSIEEKTLVMDIDDDGERSLVIDENTSDDGNTPNSDNEKTEELDDAGGIKITGKSVVREQAADIDQLTSEMVVKDGKNKQLLVKEGTDLPEETKESSDKLKESDTVESLQSKPELMNLSSETKLTNDIQIEPNISDENKQIPDKISSQTTDTSSKPSSSEPVSAVDNLLKSGQSHVLYYHDGDTGKYKPVRIFIDNSEQSSRVLQQMIQSAQFSTLDAANNTSATLNAKSAPLDAKSAPLDAKSTPLDANSVTKTSASELTVPMKGSVTIEHAKESMDSSGVIDSRHKTAKDVSSVNNDDKPSISSNGLTRVTESSSYQHAYIQSLQTQTDTDTKKNNSTTKSTKRKSSPSPRKADTALNKSHSDSKHKKKIDESNLSKPSTNSPGKTLVSNTETVTKSIPTASNLLGRKVSHYPPTKQMGVASLKALYNEGTLTRVNPDIKSRLSKALQLSSKKSGMDRSESDSFSNGGHGFDAKCMPVETIPTITTTSDTRQQL